MKAASDEAVSALDKASTALKTAIGEAETQVKAIVEKASDRATTARTDATVWLGRRGDELSAAQGKVVDTTSTYISANPLKAVGIAVVAALIVGRLFR
jgi:ElaB/YqjD/DUF883 family membrane-anchored ribosome-binding protein